MKMQQRVKTTLKHACCLTALALTGCLTPVAWAQTYVQNASGIIQSGGAGSDCPGPFTAYATMTNGAGSIWITPPAGTTNATLTDISVFPPPYASVAEAMRKSDLMTCCSDTTVSFPVTNGNSFGLKVFVISPPPTNSPFKLILQINWQ
jgi:hypothetical protein